MTVPSAIERAAQRTETLGKAARELSDLIVDLTEAATTSDCMRLAQRLRALADRVETA